MKSNYLRARVLKALSNPNRLKILQNLKGCEKCQCELQLILDKSQSTASQHLKILVDAGILSTRYVKQKKFYNIKEPEVITVVDLIDSLIKKILKYRLF